MKSGFHIAVWYYQGEFPVAGCMDTVVCGVVSYCIPQTYVGLPVYSTSPGSIVVKRTSCKLPSVDNCLLGAPS